MFFLRLVGVVMLAFSLYVGFRRSYLRISKGLNGFGYYTTADQIVYDLELKGLTILITGANSGLGLESARVLSSKGASVVLAARSLQKAQFAIDSIRAEFPSRKLLLTPLVCDLSSLASINKAMRDFESLNLELNVLINNAGIVALAKRTMTEDGFEKQMAVNHLGHFHLTNMLLPYLINAASQNKPSRIISVSSDQNRNVDPAFIESSILESKVYSPFSAYANSKMANILHAQALNDRFAKKNVFSISLHPGSVSTNIGDNMELMVVLTNPSILTYMPYMKSPSEGASTQVYAAVRAPLPHTGGKYLVDCNIASLTPKAQVLFDNISKREKLWATSEKLIRNALLAERRLSS